MVKEEVQKIYSERKVEFAERLHKLLAENSKVEKIRQSVRCLEHLCLPIPLYLRVQVAVGPHRGDVILCVHTQVLIINADNVGSQSMNVIRAELRKGGSLPKATILMGKNTMIKYVINKYAQETGNASFNKLADLCKLNVGLVFTNDDMKDVRDQLEKNKVLQIPQFSWPKNSKYSL